MRLANIKKVWLVWSEDWEMVHGVCTSEALALELAKRVDGHTDAVPYPVYTDEGGDDIS